MSKGCSLALFVSKTDWLCLTGIPFVGSGNMFWFPSHPSPHHPCDRSRNPVWEKLHLSSLFQGKHCKQLPLSRYWPHTLPPLVMCSPSEEIRVTMVNSAFNGVQKIWHLMIFTNITNSHPIEATSRCKKTQLLHFSHYIRTNESNDHN